LTRGKRLVVDVSTSWTNALEICGVAAAVPISAIIIGLP